MTEIRAVTQPQSLAPALLERSSTVVYSFERTCKQQNVPVLERACIIWGPVARLGKESHFYVSDSPFVSTGRHAPYQKVSDIQLRSVSCCNLHLQS